MPKKLTIEEMQQIAEKRGGKCLSDSYIDINTKLLWKCLDGHQWETTPTQIKRGRWCPICANKTRAKKQSLGIDKFRLLAKEKGGKCLSTNYMNIRSKLLWECSEGHRWKAAASNIQHGSWCPQCAGLTKGTIEQMQQIAKDRGGKCLSNRYINNRTKLLWECSEGHHWKATPNNIKSGKWCRICAYTCNSEKRKLGIKKMHVLARNNGGKCLLRSYKNSHTKLMWECSEGHRWAAKPTSIQCGTWCPECAEKKKGSTQRLSIEEMKELAQTLGGRCLSDNYINARRHIQWECSEGHQWPATPGSIKSGKWCPHCYGNIKLTIKEMRQIAAERGGRCISDAYVNDNTKLLWGCSEGHQWTASPDKIKRGGWCPECSSGLGERVCRVFFEQTFGKPFSKSRPKWLVNSRGNQMELDGLCKSLNLAFEHHGEQHFTTTTRYIKSKSRLHARQQDDQLKIDLCKKHRIVLIIVPEIPTRLPLDEIKLFIKKECGLNNLPLPTNFNTNKIDLTKAYIGTHSKSKLKELQGIARTRGGKCLSDSYVNARTKLLWECDKGHKWEATPYSVKKSSWCPHCSGRFGLTIEEMRAIADERGGKCLSETYINNSIKLLWKCSEGHRWKAIPNSIKRGSWCRKCAGLSKGSIGEMNKLAKKHGGTCLSKTYINSKTHLLWECAKGHQWDATPSNIKKGTWCPICKTNRRPINESRRIKAVHFCQV